LRLGAARREEEAAVDVNLLYAAYAKWCAARSAVALAEDQVTTWLQRHGASLRTGALSQTTLVVGVRVTA
jgi:hypothetical protein